MKTIEEKRRINEVYAAFLSLVKRLVTNFFQIDIFLPISLLVPNCNAAPTAFFAMLPEGFQNKRPPAYPSANLRAVPSIPFVSPRSEVIP